MKIFVKFVLLVLCVSCMLACTDDEHPVDSIEVDTESIVLNVGESYQLKAHVLPLSAILYNGIRYTSSDPQVAQVDTKGLITATYSGECMIILQANNITRKVSVQVRKVVLDFELTSGCIHSKGDTENWNSNTVVLQIIDSNLSFENDYQSITGNGVALNLVGFLPFTDPVLEDGTYTVSSEMEKNHFYAGSLVDNGDSYSVKGSFVGIYSSSGLSAIIIESGSVEVSTSGSNRILKMQFVGSKGESINATYNAPLVEKESYPQVLYTVRYTNYVVSDVISEKKSMRIVFQNATQDTLIYCVARVPETAEKELPIANYSLDDSNELFTLVKDSCYVQINSTQEKFLSGNLRVSQSQIGIRFEGRLRSENLLIHLIK